MNNTMMQTLVAYLAMARVHPALRGLGRLNPVLSKRQVHAFPDCESGGDWFSNEPVGGSIPPSVQEGLRMMY